MLLFDRKSSRMAWTMRGAMICLSLAVALTAAPVSAHPAAGPGSARPAPMSVSAQVSVLDAPPEVTSQFLIGTWLAHVVTTVPSSGDVQYVFRVDGTLTLTAGTASVDGTWQRGPGATFVFVIDQEFRDAVGNLIGTRHATQSGSLCDRDHFASRGTTLDFGADGNLIRTFDVDITGVRQ